MKAPLHCRTMAHSALHFVLEPSRRIVSISFPSSSFSSSSSQQPPQSSSQQQPPSSSVTVAQRPPTIPVWVPLTQWRDQLANSAWLSQFTLRFVDIQLETQNGQRIDMDEVEVNGIKMVQLPASNDVASPYALRIVPSECPSWYYSSCVLISNVSS